MTPRELALSRSLLMSLLAYDPATGVFTWKVQRLGRGVVGNPAGNVDPYGHRCITINQTRYMAHRLAWFYVYAEWPPQEIDHKNGCPDDNRIENLRKAHRWQNRANQKVRADSASGVKGVDQTKSLKWCATIRRHGKAHYLGRFATREAAHAAYMSAAERLFGEFARSA